MRVWQPGHSLKHNVGITNLPERTSTHKMIQAEQAMASNRSITICYLRPVIFLSSY